MRVCNAKKLNFYKHNRICIIGSSGMPSSGFSHSEMTMSHME